MYSVKNFFENDDVKVINEMGPFKVVEYQRDLSVMPSSAASGEGLVNVYRGTGKVLLAPVAKGIV